MALGITELTAAFADFQALMRAARLEREEAVQVREGPLVAAATVPVAAMGFLRLKFCAFVTLVADVGRIS